MNYFERRKLRREAGRYSPNWFFLNKGADHELSDCLEEVFLLDITNFDDQEEELRVIFSSGTRVTLSKRRSWGGGYTLVGKSGSIAHGRQSSSWRDKIIRPTTIALIYRKLNGRQQHQYTDALYGVMSAIQASKQRVNPKVSTVPTGPDAIVIPEGHSLMTFPVPNSTAQLELIVKDEPIKTIPKQTTQKQIMELLYNEFDKKIRDDDKNLNRRHEIENREYVLRERERGL